MSLGRGVLIGWVVFLAACDSSEEGASAPAPTSEVSSTEVTNAAQPAATVPSASVNDPTKATEVQQQDTIPASTPAGSSGESSVPEPTESAESEAPAETTPSESTPAQELVPSSSPEPEKNEALPPPAPEKKEIAPPPADTTPPETTFGKTPLLVTRDTSHVFEFTCSDPVAAPSTGASSDAGVKPAPTCTFICQLDVGTPASCVSPITLSPVTDGSHSFIVYAVDEAGNKDATPATFAWTVDTTGPQAPRWFSARVGNGEVSLTWSAAAGSNDTQDYDIAHCSPAGECAPPSTPQIAGVKDTAAVLGGLANCTTYEFFVRARDALLNAGPWSSAMILRPTLPAPGAPTVVEHPWQLQLSWSAVPNADSYVIYHATSSFLSMTSATPVAAVGTSWEVDFADAATRYIRIAAKDGDCESPLSRDVLAGPLGPSAFALRTMAGEAERVKLGASVSFAGDVNGDGRDDVIVGLPNADSDSSACGMALAGRGVVRVYSGATGAVLRTFCGDASGDSFGSSVSAAGDVNGDGRDDVIVGAEFADADERACPSAMQSRGIARVYSGATGAVLHRICGDAALAHLGSSVSSAGDVNGDGKDDFVVGAPWASSDPAACATPLLGRGIAQVYSGANAAVLHRWCGDAEADAFGTSVSSAGDINGDGKADVIVGSPWADFDSVTCAAPLSGRGVVRIFSGATGNIIRRFCGNAAGDGFGASVSSAGDTDADGKDEIIVGAPTANSHPIACSANLAGRGIVHIYSGSNGAVLHRFCGDATYDNFGVSVSPAGDVDGDGKADFLVGADQADSDPVACPTAADGRGIVRVYSGASGLVLHRYCGEAAGDRFGTSVSGGAASHRRGRRGTQATMGDVNADGRPEVIIGSPYANTFVPDAGKAYIFRPSDGIAPGYPVAVGATSVALSAVSPATPPYGWTILKNNSVTATITGTGSPAIYTPGSSAAVFDTIRLTDSKNRTFDSRVGTINWSLATGLGWPKAGDAERDHLGSSVSTAGDVNGDGRDDIIVGTPSADSDPTACATPLANRGAVRIYSGSSGAVLRRFCGDAAGDMFGAVVSPAGDVNGDGKGDVIVGAPFSAFDSSACPGAFPGRGVVRVYSGASGTVLHRFCGGSANVFFPLSVSTAGDVNGDGRDDIVIGANLADSDPVACAMRLPGRGIVRIYSGADGTILHRFCGHAEDDHFGGSVATAGDVNGDGKADVLIGSPNADADPTACPTEARDRGIVRVYSGADGTILHRFCGDAAIDMFGAVVSSAGDVNGDGRDDILVGATAADSDPTACPVSAENRGIVRVYSGANGTILHRFCGDTSGDVFGGSVSSAGDVNGDGRVDIIVGASRANSDPVACPLLLDNRGIARVYSGADGRVLTQFCGDGANDFFGASVSSGGDVDGDGRPDIVAGAPYAAALNEDAGKAYLFVSRQPWSVCGPPSDLRAGSVAATSVALSWRDNSNNETGFCVEFRRPTFAWITASCSVLANASTYTVTGLSPKTRYHFRIKSFHASSDSLWSSIAAATTNP